MNEMLNDRYILDIYEKISKDTNEWAYHDITHITSVMHNVDTIMKQLNMSKEMIKAANIAAFLHDIGIIDGKEGHAERSYEISKTYLNSKNVGNKDLILDAIRKHGGNDKDDGTNIIRTVLIFADKLDVRGSRIAEAGKKVEGNRQFCYVNDIKIVIDKENIVVDFICNEEMNVKELENYYFLSKIKKAIKDFANIMDFKDKVLRNGLMWEFFK